MAGRETERHLELLIGYNMASGLKPPLMRTIPAVSYSYRDVYKHCPLSCVRHFCTMDNTSSLNVFALQRLTRVGIEGTAVAHYLWEDEAQP